MLAAHFDEIPHLKIRVFDAGAAISYVDEDALCCLEVLVFDGTADAKHEVGGLLLDLIVEVLALFFGHLGDLLCAVEGKQVVHCHHVELLHLKYILRKSSVV